MSATRTPREIWFTLESVACFYIADNGPLRFGDLSLAVSVRPAALELIENLRSQGCHVALASNGDPTFALWAAQQVPVTPPIQIHTVERLRQQAPVRPPIIVGANDVPRETTSSKRGFANSTAGHILAAIGAPLSEYVCIGASDPTVPPTADFESRRLVQGRQRLTDLSGVNCTAHVDHQPPSGVYKEPTVSMYPER